MIRFRMACDVLPRTNGPERSRGPAPAEVSAELDRILTHRLFQNSKQLSALLRFAVESAVAGRSEVLKEYVIGVEVFKRDASFNPREDPVVRIAAGRVRSKLAEYYQAEGRADSLIIELPRGGYVPCFARRRSPEDAGRSQHARFQLPFVAGVAVVLMAGIAAWLLTRTLPTPQVLAPVPLTSYPGEEVEPSFSPDGTQVAFSWNGAGQDNFDIYTKQIGSDTPRRLTSDHRRDFSPAWSPDEKTIAFGRVLSSRASAICLIPASGGPERKIAESALPAAFRSGAFVAWSPDGRWIAYSDIDPAGAQLSPVGFPRVGLFLISVETGERRQLTSPPSQIVGDSGPAFAPDGHALAFVRTKTLAMSNIYWLPLARGLGVSGEPRPVTSADVSSAPSWGPDGREIIFVSGPRSRPELWRVDETGTPSPQRLGFSDGHANDPVVSRRGQLAYSERSIDINIWRTELSPAGAAAAPARLAASTLVDATPAFSPDGRRIAFISDRGGTREVWACDADGSNAVQLTSMKAPISGSPSWSPDGSRVIFDSNREGQFDLYTVFASGGAVTRLTNTPEDESHGRFSPDGRWIYFMSTRSGQRQVWKMPANGGDAVQVTKDGGVVPYPSADGKYLYYSERGGARDSNGLGGLRRIRLRDGQDERILPSVTYLNAAIGRHGIYFIPRAASGEAYSVRFFNFRTKQVTHVTRLNAPVSEGVALSPDGRYLLYTQIDSRSSDLMLVDDYRRGAQRR